MTSSTLKIIACLLMLIDHIGVILFPQYFVFRVIGRLAFPIFAFLIVEGYCHTKNISKYLLRLGVFAVISEPFFDRAFNNSWLEFSHQNVFFTLFLGLAAVWLVDHYKEKQSIVLLGLIGLTVVSIIMKSDYQAFGLLTIVGCYQYRGNFTKLCFWILSVNALLVILSVPSIIHISFRGMAQIFAIGALPIIYFYNGEKGRSLKYLFYIFYPFHIMVLYTIRLMLQ